MVLAGKPFLVALIADCFFPCSPVKAKGKPGRFSAVQKQNLAALKKLHDNSIENLALEESMTIAQVQREIGCTASRHRATSDWDCWQWFFYKTNPLSDPVTGMITHCSPSHYLLHRSGFSDEDRDQRRIDCSTTYKEAQKEEGHAARMEKMERKYQRFMADPKNLIALGSRTDKAETALMHEVRLMTLNN